MDTLYSKTGSHGNSSVVTDNSSIIQIDAGVSPEKVNQKSNYNLCNIIGVLCTHKHQDHAKYIEKYLKLGIKVYACKDVWEHLYIACNARNAVTIESGKQFNIGTFIVKPFDVAHVNSDGTPCENLGFLIYSTATKEKMLWITDASYIESRFPPMDYICIECNYIDVEDYLSELQFVNTFVEGRRFRSHLSLDRCVEFLKQQDLSHIKEIRLLHLSESQGKIEETITNRMHKEFPSVKFVI